MIDVLRNILVPGHRARLSPYVQETQLKVLFGEQIDAANREGSIREILERHDSDIAAIAATYQASRRRFTQEQYSHDEYLRMYLAYYFTTNLSKIQMIMLDMVADGKITNNIAVVDIGVGTGTTAVAVLDFLLAWATTCDLFNLPFPIDKMHIECYDINEQCLSFAKNTVLTFCDIVESRLMDIDRDCSLALAMQYVISWGREAQWIRLDITQTPIQHDKCSQVLLFASNIFNEIVTTDDRYLADAIATMPYGSIATVIEPGDQSSSLTLNSWVHTLVKNHNDLQTVFPCNAYHHTESKACINCWNSRRESLHEPQLYRSIRTKVADPRSFDEFANHLLSWSYKCIVRGHNDVVGYHEYDASCVSTYVLGLYSWNDIQKHYNAETFQSDSQQIHGQDHWIKLCAASRPNDYELWAKREAGHQIPPITYGAKVSIMGEFNITEHKKHVSYITFTSSTELRVEQRKQGDTWIPKESYSKPAVDEIGYRLFGFVAMRALQHDIIRRVLSGKSILGIAATGGGKSECYILPAMLLSGITIVISPLKSLMQDQFDQRITQRYGLQNLTTYINGDVKFADRQARLKRLELGHYKLIYMTPEQLRMGYVLNSLKRAHDRIGIRYLAMDEAHCISQWGHDFRDSYLNIITRLEQEGIMPVRIALTATASPEVRTDLCEELRLNNTPLSDDGDVYIHSSNRHELNFIVRLMPSMDAKSQDIISHLQRFVSRAPHDAAMVFMPLTGSPHNSVDYYLPVSEADVNKGRLSAGVVNFASFVERAVHTKIAIYHGQMDDSRDEEPIDNEHYQAKIGSRRYGDLSGRQRKNEQSMFIEDKRRIMVATKGFGMGIDKPNIRLIIHRTPPSNLEAYAQEAGRAGRDGNISDVILYYSPDDTEEGHTKIQSDYKIQAYFLREKYIRRIDVEVIRDFLGTVQRRVGDHMYFTNDEVIHFFEQRKQRGYVWPDFPPRKPADTESYEHKTILDRGYDYEKKTGYISRILSALYRIRPDIGNHRRLSMLETVQETRAVLHGVQITEQQAQEIVKSNNYYGELLRDKNINAGDLMSWLQVCEKDDTIQFAQALGLSMFDTENLLSDINRSDGHIVDGGKTPRWESSLLNWQYFGYPKYGPAKGLSGASWSAYAGASYRKLVHGNWFPEYCLTKPKGWEVKLGFDLDDNIVFQQYLDAFMDIHDRREANDWAAYQLLLSDYVGLEDSQRCLRAVLLGYLKTGEVVKGNCRSCSRCVPDLNFEQDMVIRKQVVERLGADVVGLMNELESAVSYLAPYEKLLELWNHVEVMEADHRSLKGYIEGWTGRLITETPQHKTALWLRVDGMMRGVLTLQTKLACNWALDLIHTASVDDMTTIQNTIDLFENLKSEVPQAIEVLAAAYQKTGCFVQALPLWIELASSNNDLEMKHRAHAALSHVFASQSSLHDDVQKAYHAIQAARTTLDFSTITKYYLIAKKYWPWNDIREEALYYADKRPTITEQLLKWWVFEQSELRLLAEPIEYSDWVSIVDEARTHILLEKTSNTGLDIILSTALLDLISDDLQRSVVIIPMLALRIVLVSDGYGPRESLISDCRVFNSKANRYEKSWLTQLLGLLRSETKDEKLATILELVMILNDSESEQNLAYLEALPEEVINDYHEDIVATIRTQEPMQVASQAIVSKLYLRDIDRRKPITPKPIGSYQLRYGYSDYDIMFIVSAYFEGRLDMQHIDEINIPHIICEELNNNQYEQIKTRYLTVHMTKILSGFRSDFLFDYQPETPKTLRRWLPWFLPIVDESQHFRNRVSAVVTETMYRVLSLGRNTLIDMTRLMSDFNLDTYIQYAREIRQFIEIIDRFEQVVKISLLHKFDGQTISTLKAVVNPSASILQADILSAILLAIHRRSRTTWMTPISYLVENLAASGRTDDARNYCTSTSLRIGPNRDTLERYLANVKCTTRQAPEYDELLTRLAQLYVRSWPL